MSLSCSKYVSLATHLLYELLNNTESNTNTSPTMLALVALTYAWSHVLSILVMKLKGIVHLNIIFSYMKVNKICYLNHPAY